MMTPAAFTDGLERPPTRPRPPAPNYSRRYALAPFDAGGSPTLQVPTNHQLSQQVDP